MNHQEIRRHVAQWIENTLGVPSPHFNGLPPCPYSRSALMKNRVDARYASGPKLLQDLAAIADSWDDSYDVVVVMCDKSTISVNELIEGAAKLSRKLEGRDLLVNFEHPDCTDPKYLVVSTNGRYAMGVIQRLSGFVKASRPLFKQDYYKNIAYEDLSHYTSFKGNFSSKEEWLLDTFGIQFVDSSPEGSVLIDEIRAGLSQRPKSLPSKLNYLGAGAELYEQICETPGYYLTRVELSIMERHIEEMSSRFPEKIQLVEYGSGNSRKAQLLFNSMPNMVSYMPIDISKEQLVNVAIKNTREHRGLEVLPVCADYTRPFTMPRSAREFSRRLIYYPGSTIGNQAPQAAALFLERLRQECSPGDALLIGVDLRKEPALLKNAYDDDAGRNRDFILNPLAVMKQELGVGFTPSNYQHHVSVDEDGSRVLVQMKSLSNHVIQMGEDEIFVSEGELILRAVSHKYTLDGFRAMAQASGWRVEDVWLDEQGWFSVQYLSAVR